MEKIKSGALTVFLLWTLPVILGGCGGGCGFEGGTCGYDDENSPTDSNTLSITTDIEGSLAPTDSGKHQPPAAASESMTIPSGPS